MLVTEPLALQVDNFQWNSLFQSCVFLQNKNLSQQQFQHNGILPAEILKYSKYQLYTVLPGGHWR